MDVSTIMTAVVAFLAPYTPALLALAKTGAEETAKTLAKKGTEDGWDKAKKVWGKLKDKFGDDEEVELTTKLLALQPDDEDKQTQLAVLLAKHAADDPELVAVLATLLGGQERVQEMIADNGVLKKVRQKMTGSGTQSMKATNGGRIEDASQTMN